MQWLIIIGVIVLVIFLFKPKKDAATPCACQDHSAAANPASSIR